MCAKKSARSVVVESAMQLIEESGICLLLRLTQPSSVLGVDLCDEQCKIAVCLSGFDTVPVTQSQVNDYRAESRPFSPNNEEVTFQVCT
jgi:hypothetical protein